MIASHFDRPTEHRPSGESIGYSDGGGALAPHRPTERITFRVGRFLGRWRMPFVTVQQRRMNTRVSARAASLARLQNYTVAV